ncbi:MAG: cysteine-rich CWC family protein [Anaerolineae bacterium]|nr:cysteine-rich CWC family protein [Anaerolineae bacterium]MBN8619520.1 cysteine-rich CWC family protein [Anaerolineae bacterium]
MSHQPAHSNPPQKTCPRCGASFTCGVAAAQSHCWCFDLPNVHPLQSNEYTGCLCPSCLRERIASHQKSQASPGN